MKDSLITALLQSGRKFPKPRTPKEHSDLVHEYTGGKAGETLARYWDASKTPGRFLADLGKPFRRMLGDDFSWQQIMEIYAGMKNEFSHRAILYGNFMSNYAEHNTLYLTEDSAMNAINQILAFINRPENERYRQAWRSRRSIPRFMVQQERDATLDGLAADVFVAPTQKGSEFGSVKEAVEKLAGAHAWEYLRNIFRNLARFIGMASTGRLNEFLENVYQLYPELRRSTELLRLSSSMPLIPPTSRKVCRRMTLYGSLSESCRTLSLRLLQGR